MIADHDGVNTHWPPPFGSAHETTRSKKNSNKFYVNISKIADCLNIRCTRVYVVVGVWVASSWDTCEWLWLTRRCVWRIYFSSLDKAVGSLCGISCTGFVLVWPLGPISLLGFD